MNPQIIVNLPVKNLDRSKAFFSTLGFRFDPQFCSPDAALMIIVDDGIQAMLMTEPFFKSLIDKPVAQAREASEVIICLSCEGRDEVDRLIGLAVAAGARVPHPPEDRGFMYDQGFEDLDGHLWNLVWMGAPA